MQILGRTLDFRPPNMSDRILMTLLIFPTGVFWFVFLDIVDICFVYPFDINIKKMLFLRIFVEVPLFIFCRTRQEDSEAIKMKEKILSTFGLTYAQAEGYQQQKTIATLFFEVSPKIVKKLLLVNQEA